ncbi:MAG: hypothetical protein CL535_16355 [Ahrensia sp.]|nr:hypothetical protein [Ahrensia sp.]MBV48247.1 hypothetical protein [Roseobacter sp.]|tara:strand:- start:122701 stop:123120 length:420 start_codon:yes stop_codon:yes gene_type:complete
MVDLVITAANVAAGANATTRHGTAGETITAGQAVYLDQASTGEWLLADSDGASAAVRGGELVGIALNGASDGQPIKVQLDGDITIGATLTAGTTYYLSDAPGGICPIADLATGDYYVIVGIATSTSVLKLGFQYSGVAA